MANKRQVLAQLSRAELLNFVTETGVEVSDRRVRDKLVDALATSRSARLPALLSTLSRDRLKQLAGALGLETGGRDKAAFVDRLSGAAPSAAAKPVPSKRGPRAAGPAGPGKRGVVARTSTAAPRTAPSKVGRRK